MASRWLVGSKVPCMCSFYLHVTTTNDASYTKRMRGRVLAQAVNEVVESGFKPGHLGLRTAFPPRSQNAAPCPSASGMTLSHRTELRAVGTIYPLPATSWVIDTTANPASVVLRQATWGEHFFPFILSSSQPITLRVLPHPHPRNPHLYVLSNPRR